MKQIAQTTMQNGNFTADDVKEDLKNLRESYDEDEEEEDELAKSIDDYDWEEMKIYNPDLD